MFGFIPPIPLAPPPLLPKQAGPQPLDRVPANPFDSWYWPNLPPIPLPSIPLPSLPDLLDPLFPELPDAPIPDSPDPSPIPDPVPGDDYIYPPNPADPTTDVRWDIVYTIRDQQFPLKSCTTGKPSAPVDELVTYTEYVTGVSLKIKTRQGRLVSDGCDAGYQGFHPDNVSVPAIEAEYLYSDGVWRDAFTSRSLVGNNRVAGFDEAGLDQLVTTTIVSVKRNDLLVPSPEPAPDPGPKPRPLPVPLRPIEPFPLTDPNPQPEPEPEEEPNPLPIPSPDTPNAPPFTPPKAPPAPPEPVPNSPPSPSPLPLPVPAPAPIPVPVPGISPQPEPTPEPGTTPAPGPAPQPVPNPNPAPGPAPVPEPGIAPGVTPIPLPGIDPGVSPSPNPAPLPEGAYPIWPWRPPVPPPENNIVPTKPKYHYPVKGGPPIGPGGVRADLQAIADEVGRIEAKGASSLNRINTILQLIDALEDIIGDGNSEPITYELSGICEDVGEDADQPRESWIIPETNKMDGLVQRVDTIAEMLQVHLGLKTPTCGSENKRPEIKGDFRTINFRSDSTSPYGKAKLRKRFRYRSESEIDLGELVDHWKDFKWTAGAVCVIHKGSSVGLPQVWADSEDEGKRVIRHAFAEAGVNPDAVGEWIVTASKSDRYGVAGEMSVDTTGGFYWITARDGSNGRPLVART